MDSGNVSDIDGVAFEHADYVGSAKSCPGFDSSQPNTNPRDVPNCFQPTDDDNNEWHDWKTLLSSLRISKDACEISEKDMIGKQFRCPAEAGRFYNLFSNYTGFSVREGPKRKSATSEIRSYTWFCSRQGYREKKYLEMEGRKREPRQLTRNGCNVVFRILHNRGTGLWDVKKFICNHNHTTAVGAQVNLLRSHRQVPKGTLQTARAMQSVGIRTWQIMSYVVEQNGGYGKIGFIMKDLWNRLGEEEALIADTDAARAIGYLQRMSDNDPGCYAKYCIDQNRRLLSLVWMDSMMKNNYMCFGKAIAFDTTYKTNKYKTPLLIFVGVNNHFRTVVLGFALIMDETVDTYKWALRTFVECMKGVTPMSIITDRDPAMKRAIADVMPNAVHRLCSWHLEKNAASNVKNIEFLTAFKRLMFRLYSEDDFEAEWRSMMQDLKLEDNAWVKSIYEKRKSWADTFLRGNYFAGMTTTQRNEGINSYLKTKLNPNSSLHQLVRHLDRGVEKMRQQEILDDFATHHSVPVLHATNMGPIEQQVADLYTSRMFYKVRKEIAREGKYMLKEMKESENVVVCLFNKYGYEAVARKVTYNRADSVFSCECNKLETFGIPCRHIFATMKYLNMTRMPMTLIQTQWTKTAKRARLEHNSAESYMEIDDPKSKRFGQITSSGAEIAYYASRNETLFAVAKTKLHDLSNLLKQAWETGQGTEIDDNVQRVQLPDVGNPNYSQTKGSASSPSGKPKKKQCTWCKVRGHNRQTCPVRKAQQRAQRDETSPRLTTSQEDGETIPNIGEEEEETHIMVSATQGWNNEPSVHVGAEDTIEGSMQSRVVPSGLTNLNATKSVIHHGGWWGDRGF